MSANAALVCTHLTISPPDQAPIANSTTARLCCDVFNEPRFDQHGERRQAA